MNPDSRSFEDDLSSLKADVAVIRSNHSTKEDLQECRIELKGDIHRLRTELKDDIHGLRTELKDDIHGLRTELKDEIHGLRTELMGEIEGLRTDGHRLGAGLRGDLSALGTELRAELSGVRLDNEKFRVELEMLRAEFHKALHAQTWKIYGVAVVLVTAVHFATRAGY
jgi:hypothetical protein